MKKIHYYQPEILGVIIALAILNVWYLSSIAIEKSVIPESYDYIMRFMTVAIGGFIGAYSAFWLRKYEDNKSDLSKQKNSLNKALFVLVRQLNAILNIKSDFDKYDTPFHRGLSLPAMKPHDYSDLKLDIESLSFLLENRHPQILLELVTEQERFDQAMSAINIRNEFYVNEVQPALSFHALNGRPLPLEEFEEKLGERLFQGALNGATTMYEHVYASEITLEQTYSSLRKLAKELFPDDEFLKLINLPHN